MKLCDEFIKEMKLESIPFVEKAIACEMLKLVVGEPKNRSYEKFRTDDFDFFTEDILSNSTLIKLLNVAGYWSNDTFDILLDYLKDNKIDSPLASKGYLAIFDFLNKKLKESVKKFVVFNLETNVVNCSDTKCFLITEKCFNEDGSLNEEYISNYGNMLARDNAEMHGLLDDEDADDCFYFTYKIVEFDSIEEAEKEYGSVYKF